jgi:hypothetical protein
MIGSLVSRIETLAPLPACASRLAAVVDDPESGIDDVVEAIRFDQALTATVLREANATSSASRRVISSVKGAVVRLGGARVLSRCLAGAIKAQLVEALPGYGYDERELWRHSVAAAVAAEELGVAFTASLLHDIGKLVLGRQAEPETMQAVWNCVEKDACTADQAETIVLGFSHAALGADFCGDTVIVANIIAHCIGAGLGYEGMSIAAPEMISGRLGLSKENFERVCANTLGRLRQVLELYEQ